MHIKEKHMVTLVHDSRKMAASESSDVPRQEWLLGQTALSVSQRYMSRVGDRLTKFQDALWNKGSSKPHRLVTVVSVEWARKCSKAVLRPRWVPAGPLRALAENEVQGAKGSSLGMRKRSVSSAEAA